MTFELRFDSALETTLPEVAHSRGKCMTAVDRPIDITDHTCCVRKESHGGPSAALLDTNREVTTANVMLLASIMHEDIV